MAVFRIEKTRDYTVMSNHHLKDRTLTLKSKGLLSMMLSLPDEWNYTTRGLAAICREGVDSIGAALKELETHGYIRRTQLRDEKGKITDTEYLLMKYLSVQREKSRKYSQRWQQQHTADELKTIAAAVNYLSEHGISNLDELDASLSSVSDRAYSIRAGMKTAEERMKKLQKLIEYGKNYTEYKPIHDELKKLQNGWTNKRDKYEEAHRAELTLWDAANRYLHANLPKGTKTLPIAEWEQEYADLKTQRDSDYTKLKNTRAEVAELQKIRRCVDIALHADQPEQTQSRTKRHDIDR